MPTASIEQMLHDAVRQHQAGRVTEAAAIYQQILALDPNHLNALQLLGVASGQLKRPDVAVELIRQAIAINASIPAYHFNLGVALTDNGQPDQAIEAYRQVIRLNPDHADAWHNLAAALKKTAQLADAIEAYRQLVRLRPDQFEPQHQLAQALELTGKLDEAVAEFVKAIGLAPDSAETHNNLGMVLKQQHKFDEAIAAYEKAIRLMPDSCEIHNNLGNALCSVGRFDEATRVYEQAVRLKPDSPDVHQNIAIFLTKIGRPAQAIEAYERVIQLKSDSPDAHWSLAFALLLDGDFERGWLKHEWRLQLKENLSKRRHFDKPRWDGGDLKGKTLLLHAEQGYGDTIQFVRYVPMVLNRGGRVLLECPEELVRLLQGLPGPEKVSPRITQFDVQCPLPSLPLVFGTRLETIPASVPYIEADATLVQAWRKKLPPARDRLRVGLTWAGRPTHLNDRNRSLSLAQLAPLAKLNVDFHSLQIGPAAAQAGSPPTGMELIHHTPELHDFAETAALISHLDLVISVDTAVVHLAGAMGKPVWILLPFAPDWRWMMNRDDSPWYPTARLFRQKTLGDWTGAVAQVADELYRLIPTV